MMPRGSVLCSPTTAYSGWMLSHGDALTYIVEVFALEGSVTFKVSIETKNPDDTTVTTPSGDATLTITTKPSVPQTGRVTGLRRLFRYKIEVTGGSGDEQFAHYEIFDPIREVDHA